MKRVCLLLLATLALAPCHAAELSVTVHLLAAPPLTKPSGDKAKAKTKDPRPQFWIDWVETSYPLPRPTYRAASSSQLPASAKPLQTTASNRKQPLSTSRPPHSILPPCRSRP